MLLEIIDSANRKVHQSKGKGLASGCHSEQKRRHGPFTDVLHTFGICRNLKVAGLSSIVILLLFALLSLPSVEAQSDSGKWSQPQLLTDPDRHCGFVTLLPTRTGKIHAFWSCARDREEAKSTWDIYYSLYDGEWTYPLDIVTGGHYIDAVFDQAGRVHLFWSSGAASGLYHAWSVDAELDSAHSWSEPMQIAQGTQEFDVILDDAGTMHLALTPAMQSVAYMRSTDNGRTWISPVNVVGVGDDLAYRYADIAADDQGGLHIVWTPYPLPDAWPPLGVFYSHSRDNGLSWSAPEDLSFEQGEDGPPGKWTETEPIVEAYNDNLICVVWNGGIGTGRRFFRASSSGGTTWHDAVAFIMPKGGIVGRSAMTRDSEGELHIAMPTGENTGLFYATGSRQTFTPPDRLVSSGNFGQVDIAITHGNHLHLVYPVKTRGIWAMTRIIDAPYVEPASSHRVSDRKTPTPSPSPIPSPTYTPVAEAEVSQIEQPSGSPNSLYIVLLGSGLPAVIVLGVVIWHLSQSRR